MEKETSLIAEQFVESKFLFIWLDIVFVICMARVFDLQNLSST